MTLSLREPNQIFASPQYKSPIESSQMSHKTEINFGTLSILFIDHHVLCEAVGLSREVSFHGFLLQIIKDGGHGWCGVTSFVSVEQSIGVSAATSPGPGPILAP